MRCTIHDKHGHLVRDIDYLGYKFKLNIYDYAEHIYVPRETWCPADDIISEQIDQKGHWEEYETALISDILKQPRRYNRVYDFGSQIGWYSMLALLSGYNVHSFEADEESASLLLGSVHMNGTYNIEVQTGIVDKESKVRPADRIHLLKCDIEGEEPEAFRIMKDSFLKGDVDYAVFEISPVFHDRYPALIKNIKECGYRAYVIPNAADNNAVAFLADPLNEIQKQPEVDQSEVNSWHQRNVLFVRNK